MKFWVFIVGLLCVCSCKKELKCENAVQLVDERTSFLVGEWKWEYTTRRVLDKGTGNTTEDTIFHYDNEDSYKIEFIENGKVYLWINDKITNEFCMVDSTNINSNFPNKIYTNFSLSNNEEEGLLSFMYTINSSIISLTVKDTKFPYSYEETVNEQIFYKNYFQKQ